jgi:hypothetical protein
LGGFSFGAPPRNAATRFCRIKVLQQKSEQKFALSH